MYWLPLSQNNYRELSLSNISTNWVWQQNRSIKLNIGIMPVGWQRQRASQRDGETFKLFDMKCRARIEDFHLIFLLTIYNFFLCFSVTIDHGDGPIWLIARLYINYMYLGRGKGQNIWYSLKFHNFQAKFPNKFVATD